MRECDIGTYHEPPPIGYGYDLPNFSCTICWPLGRSFSTAASPNRQVNACRSLRCAARTCLTLQIQSSGPCGFVHFFLMHKKLRKKKTSGKPLSNCHPSKTYTSCTVHHFWHSSYIFHPPNKKNLLKMAQTFRLLPFLLRVWHLWSTESWASCISAEPHEVTAIGFVGVFTTLFPTKIHNSCLGSNS